jgi:hypothetical protein
MIVQRGQASESCTSYLSKRYASPARSGTFHVYKMIRIACSVHVVDRVSAIVTQCICHSDKVSWVPLPGVHLGT